MTDSKRAPTAEEIQQLFQGMQLRFSIFYGRTLAKFNLSFTQFSMMVALVHQKRQKMSQLAKALNVSLPAVTHQIDQLEQKGFVQRLSYPTDRRVTMIELTKAGKSVTAKTQGRTLKMLTELLMKFPSNEKKVVARFMSKLSEDVAAIIGEN